MNIEEIIDLALAEYGPLFKPTDEFEVKIGSDDGGRTIDFFVVGPENAEILRSKLPNKYHGYRSVVVYRYEPDYELNDEEF